MTLIAYDPPEGLEAFYESVRRSIHAVGLVDGGIHAERLQSFLAAQSPYILDYNQKVYLEEIQAQDVLRKFNVT